LCERGAAGRREPGVEVKTDAGAREVRAERVGALERRKPRENVRPYVNLISYITAAPVPRAIWI
jgi:hypothetical protein